MGERDDRKVIVDEPLGHGRTACVECGRTGERRLSERFPHVCGQCLFPPASLAALAEGEPEFLPVVSLIERLHQRNLYIGSVYPDENRLGSDSETA